MSVTKTAASATFAGNGSSVTPYDVGASVDLPDPSHLLGFVDGRELIRGTDFFPQDDGTVTTAAAYAVEQTVSFVRDSPDVQGRTFSETETPRGKDVEGGLDYLTRLMQERDGDLAFALTDSGGGYQVPTELEAFWFRNESGAIVPYSGAQVAALVQAELNIEAGAVAGKGFGTAADNASLDTLAPEVTGQPLVQLDNGNTWLGRSQVAGDWGILGDFQLAESYWHQYPGADPVVPSEAIRRHLDKVDSNTIKVAYADDIEAAGLTCDEVLLAACFWLDNGADAMAAGAGNDGYWARGDILLKTGTYNLKNQLDLPGRVNLHGPNRNVRDAGTVIRVALGGDLESGGASKFIVKSNPTDGVQHDGAFFCSISNLSVECDGICSGVWWGGAQCSSARNLQIRNVHATGKGFHLGYGSNGFTMQGIWVDGGLLGDNYAFDFGTYVFGIAMIGCKGERAGTSVYVTGASQVAILGYYNESCGLPLHIDGGGGSTTVTAIGFDSKNITGRIGGRAAVALTTQDSLHLYMDGRVRNTWDGDAGSPVAVEVGVQTASSFIRVASDVKGNGDMRTFKFDHAEYFEKHPRDLSGGTELFYGRRYYDAFDADDVTYTFEFQDHNTQQPDIWLQVIVVNASIIRFPLGVYLDGTAGLSYSINLPVGNYTIKFTLAGGKVRASM